MLAWREVSAVARCSRRVVRTASSSALAANGFLSTAAASKAMAHFFAIASDDDVVAVMAQKNSGQMTHAWLVIDDEHDALPGTKRSDNHCAVCSV